jgi:RNA-directed DNA polymerase
MTDKRQKKQLKLTFARAEEGEALAVPTEGIESEMATTDTENPALDRETMKEVLRPENLKKALKQVMRNKGAAGIDGMTVEQLPEYLKENWTRIRSELVQGRYAPQAVRRVEIPKPTGGMRQLGIPSVVDRFVQQALLQILQRHWDSTFSPHSYGFRPGKSAHQAVQQAQQYVGSGLRIVVDIDLEQFFDRVNHDILMGLIAKRVTDSSVRKLIRTFLNAGVMENGLVKPTEEGTPQGGPLSPFLSNVMLDELDRELEKRRLKFVRYADDSNIYVRTERAGKRVMHSITKFLERRLKLKVNKAKSAVAKPWKRKFLGFSFTSGKVPKRRIAPQAVTRLKDKIRGMTSRLRGGDINEIAEELASYLTGWRGYFGFCETPTVLQALDQWIRRRLRSLIWKRWKRGKVRYTELRKRGLTERQAAAAACTNSPWRASGLAAMHAAFPIAFFKELGIPTLFRASSA